MSAPWPLMVVAMSYESASTRLVVLNVAPVSMATSMMETRAVSLPTPAQLECTTVRRQSTVSITDWESSTVRWEREGGREREGERGREGEGREKERERWCDCLHGSDEENFNYYFFFSCSVLVLWLATVLSAVLTLTLMVYPTYSWPSAVRHLHALW